MKGAGPEYWIWPLFPSITLDEQGRVGRDLGVRHGLDTGRFVQRALPQGSLAWRLHPGPAEQESGTPSSPLLSSHLPISAFLILIGSEPLACD